MTEEIITLQALLVKSYGRPTVMPAPKRLFTSR